jgi:type II secretory pathway component GspD/PulD (secretin)
LARLGRAAALTAAFWLLALSAPGFAAPRFCEALADDPKPAWSDRKVRIAVMDQALGQTLEDIGSLASLAPTIGPGVKGRIRHQRIEGSVIEVVGRLAELNGLAWFGDGRQIQVASPEETVSRILTVTGANEANLCRSLQRFEVLGEGLELVVDDRSGLVRVAGPANYVAFVESILGSPMAQMSGDDITLIKFGSISSR